MELRLVWYCVAACVAAVAIVMSFVAMGVRKKHLPKCYREIDYEAKARAEYEAMKRETGGDSELLEKLIRRKAERDCTREAFKERKLPSDIDAVIVGSGIGGLMCAGLLARCGWRVVVLEQHYVAGGCTHCFDDKGYEFDTGVHYVGKINRYAALLDLVSDRPLMWNKLGSQEDGYVYDEIALADRPIHAFRSGIEAFRGDLVAKFPEEEAAIDEYIRLVKEANDSGTAHFMIKLLPSWLENLVRPFATRKFKKYAGVTVGEVLDGLTQNKELRALLCGQFGDYGLAPRDASFFIQAGIAAHYFGGAWYPDGGPQEIARHIIPVIEAAGGAVFVKAPVLQILYDSTTATAVGVQLANKTQSQIFAPVVISAAGAANTYGRLLSDAALHKLGLKVEAPETPIDGVKPSVTHIYCFVGLKASPEELKLRSSNLWVLPCSKESFDLSAMREEYFEHPMTAPMLMFIGFPAAKDPSWNERFPDKSTCVIITEAKFDWFAKHLSERPGHRSDAYKEMKHKFGERILEEGLYRHYPQTRGFVDYVEVGTPLTNVNYIAAPSGESYGLEHTPKRYTTTHAHLRPKTAINGLYLTGQDVATAGFAGGLMGGVLTAHAILGYPSFSDILQGRELITELSNARNMRPASWFTACQASLD